VRRWQFILWRPEITFEWWWAWWPRITRWPTAEHPTHPVFGSIHWGPFEIRRYR